MILAENDADFNSKILQHEYDIFVATFHFNETYDLRYLLHSNYNNIIGYSNPELDSLLDKMKTGISGNEAADTYEKIKEILKEDLPYYCILYKTYSAMLSENVKGVDALYFNDYYKDAKNWYCEYQIK